VCSMACGDRAETPDAAAADLPSDEDVEAGSRADLDDGDAAQRDPPEALAAAVARRVRCRRGPKTCTM
jgi:hypothetical protein